VPEGPFRALNVNKFAIDIPIDGPTICAFPVN
jgi:hypothetical protein